MCDTVISEPIQKIQKEIPSWQKRDTVFAVITLISSVLFVDWSVFGGFNAGFTASLLLLYALTFAYNGGKSRHIGAFSVFCAAASVGFSAIFSVYNDSLMNLIFLPLRSYCTVFPSQVFSAGIKIRPRCSVSSIHCL